MAGIKEICEPWEDVFDASLDEHLAPELDELLSNKRSIYTDAYEFFSRTYLTESILNSLKNIINVLKGEGGNNTFVIYSLFGGGKTHSLFAIYHAIKKPEVLMHEDVLKGYDEIKKKEIKQIEKDRQEIAEKSRAEMGFLHPAFLIGAALGAVPVLIHLIFRLRKRRVRS